VLPYGLFLPYFAEVYVGWVVYSMIRKRVVPRGSLTVPSVLVLCLGVAGLCMLYESRFLSLSCAVATGCLLLFMMRWDRELGGLVPVRILSMIGVSSYSIYLLHVPLWPLAEKVVRVLVPFSTYWTAPLVLLPGILTVSFVWYLFFERPLTQSDVVRSISAPIHTIVSGTQAITMACSAEYARPKHAD
jgi:peptidoglycan/LPS O-acetylase OafA/YrhL